MSVSFPDWILCAELTLDGIVDVIFKILLVLINKQLGKISFIHSS
jgi:hypothetical protein